MNKKILKTLAGAVAAIALSGSAVSAETVLRLAENQPDTNPVTIAMLKFADLAKEYSNGEITVDVIYGGQLGQEPETIEQAQAGVIDMTRVNSVVLANVSPSMGVFALPYIFADWDHKYKVLDGEVGTEVLEDLNDVGLIGLGYMDAGSRSFYTVEGKPVTKLEDLEGLKIRVQPAPISIRMVELLGAVPTPMNYGEVYSALQTGVIDGAENDYVSYHTSAHYEVAPNYVEDAHLSPPALLLMNKAKFESLPADQQAALKKAAAEAVLYEREIMREANEKARKTVEEGGATVVEIDNGPFQEAVMPIYDEFSELKPLIDKINQAK
ncbi:TRAP transporter substrate-binding protein [Roseibium marinum]|uniref:Tripartite ATP-independent transporter DctP family solute receptor n=1 Tax=Roseibium marinum TaxID=281252 RepID=A0A2S3UZ58_9HYPH|nr:TRAP transporter substrate-binding protein [Roseibium marinum]POF32749.1 tripartite ATP-independent transporter DctP family solute receptor [Roseibium marinum]